MDIIGLQNKTFPGALFESVRLIKAGGVIVFPTDTVYGIGGNALDSAVSQRVIRIKNRSDNKGMVILVKDIAMARKYAYIDLWTEKFLEDIWPAPISIILHKKDTLPDAVTGGQDTVAVRFPKHQFLNDLLKQIDVPLIATSANISGDDEEPRSLAKFLSVIEAAEEKPDLVLDAGVLPSAFSSTLIDFTNKKKPVILRLGAFSKEELDGVIARHP